MSTRAGEGRAPQARALQARAPEARTAVLRAGVLTRELPVPPDVPAVSAPSLRGAPGSAPPVLLVVHGTRRASGVRVAEALRGALARRTGRPVHLAHADVRAPDVTEALAQLAGPVTLVPAFLASGHHVRTDIPAQVERAGRTDVHVTPPLGPGPALLAALVDRLVESGARAPGSEDAVVLAGAGSLDPGARAEVEGVAERLGHLLGCPVPVGWAATSAPSVADTVARLRAEGARRVAVATWLLAPGLFADRLHASGADTVAAPLAAHPAVVALLAERAGSPGGAARGPVRDADGPVCGTKGLWHTPAQVTSDSDQGPGPLSGNPPSVAGCPG